MVQGIIRFPQKPVSLEGCNANWVAEYLSISLTQEHTPKPIEEPFALYRLSYMYYTVVGAVTAIVSGAIVSYLTGCNKGKKLSKDLFSPVIHGLLKEELHDSVVGVKMEDVSQDQVETPNKDPVEISNTDQEKMTNREEEPVKEMNGEI